MMEAQTLILSSIQTLILSIFFLLLGIWLGWVVWGAPEDEEDE